MRKSFYMCLMAAILLPMFGCSSDDPIDSGGNTEVNVSSVSVDPTSIVLTVGEKATLKLVITPENATIKQKSWSSSDISIVEVTDGGVVTAMAVGQAVVSVSINGMKASCDVVVKDSSQPEKPDDPNVPDTPLDIKGTTATVNMDALSEGENIADVIAQADQKGVVEYVLHGAFDKLGITETTNPFRNTKAEVIDMTGVTDWPQLPLGDFSRAGTAEGLYSAAFKCQREGELVLRKLLLPERVKVIGVSAFEDCSTLQTIIMPGVVEICMLGFSGCTGLMEIDAPKLELIGEEAFSNCDGLSIISFPAVKEVGVYAFYGCDYVLTEINLPEAVILRSKCFSDVEYLSKVNLPKVQVVEAGAFQYSIRNDSAFITLPMAESIGDNAFQCPELVGLSLPKATKFGATLFDSCSKLHTLELNAPGKFEIAANAFELDMYSSAGRGGDYVNFSTTNCDLILNPDKKDEVQDKVWMGKTWKSITFKSPE
ncbi:leucine-rich repeat protein [uncultured Bacteroides sp.]|uniref:leucine-rich repeat protein n=1 Tax=uncultured Bacteroides sp. TaxID=162156 RepID=UPI0026065EC2|nr:leucine-rich repeat protein [uncultured Bacteroides sp.]